MQNLKTLIRLLESYNFRIRSHRKKKKKLSLTLARLRNRHCKRERIQQLAHQTKVAARASKEPLKLTKEQSCAKKTSFAGERERKRKGELREYRSADNDSLFLSHSWLPLIAKDPKSTATVNYDLFLFLFYIPLMRCLQTIDFSSSPSRYIRNEISRSSLN